ncbi:hypothetical protein JS531_04645 [Bifidobacterium sp. CP2]|uniref:hypothetical protein n=1 Tax=Bifidobacterium sp. CP2 TaxID=2809025 RepID=UPI001BDC3129|nr:hypothetical protein [Bifidobacterium sp. CP2]MBT1181269.1 hypothetical protein [Bifidobacterium sp. CP2]
MRTPICPHGSCAVNRSVILPIWALAPAMLTWAMGRVPAGRSGAGSGLLTVFRQFGSIIGVGIFGSVQSGLYVSRFRDAARVTGLGERVSAGSVTLDFQQTVHLGKASGDMLRQAASRAYESAMFGSFAVATVIIVATTVIVAGISRRSR